MAKKKDKKKKSGKKDQKKKDLKKKALLKKELKKKKLKKRKAKKEKSRKKELKEKRLLTTNKAPKTKQAKAEKPTIHAESISDHSSKYNVREAIAKLRSLKTAEEVNGFTNGENRISILRAIPAAFKNKKDEDAF